jgi:hypothetical protein
MIHRACCTACWTLASLDWLKLQHRGSDSRRAPTRLKEPDSRSPLGLHLPKGWDRSSSSCPIFTGRARRPTPCLANVGRGFQFLSASKATAPNGRIRSVKAQRHEKGFWRLAANGSGPQPPSIPSSVMKRSRRSRERSPCLPSWVATRFSSPSQNTTYAPMLLLKKLLPCGMKNA